ncbi:MAG: oligosaccharide flippase family protein [Deltaproteobacteria bacterium]|nr:oligosaccharide flippase family protein [Deltaproteobacteria bacterium]
MSLIQRLGKSSAIYTITTILQNGIAFFLLPLYTRYLTPNDYGILAVVNSINGFLTIFLMLSLHGAMTRFYFDYRFEPEKLKAFWGTILTFILIFSIGVGGLLILFGQILFKPVIGEIPFWPFVVLGIGVVIFQPFFTIYLGLLQTREQTKKYAILSLTQFVVNVGLAISLVVFAGWGAEGPLTATLITAVLFFMTSIYALREDVVFGINKFYLKEALRYSLPLVPHSLASQISNATGKLFLNYLVNTGSAGLYNIGFMFGSIIGVVSDGINKAYVPISMGILSTNKREELDHLKNIVLFLVVMYCLLGTVISLFSKEAIFILTTEAFYESYIIVPFLAFYFVLGGIYYFLVNILFFVKKATKFVAIGTGIGAVSNILLSWLLIPRYGLFGAAVATMLAQVIGTFFIGFIGHAFEIIHWEYRKFISIFILSAIFSFSLLIFKDLNLWSFVGIKAIAFGVLFFLLNYIAWGDPFFLITHGKKLFFAMVRIR